MDTYKHGAVVVLLKDGKVLAVSRKHDHSDFGLPGGKLDGQELFEEAARRELLEETSIVAGKMTKVWERFDGDLYAEVFLVHDWTGEAKQMEGGLVQWVDWSVIEAGSFGHFNTQLREILSTKQDIHV